MTAKLRHIAIAVKDLEGTAQFYEKTFGFKRVKKSVGSKFGDAIALSDGTINITFLYFPTEESTSFDARGKDFVGLHHIGFVVDDIKAMGERVVQNGGRPHKDRTGELPAEEYNREGFELKCRDPNGVVFDLSHGWLGTD